MQTVPCVLFTTGTLPATKWVVAKGEGAFVSQEAKGTQSCWGYNTDALCMRYPFVHKINYGMYNLNSSAF